MTKPLVAFAVLAVLCAAAYLLFHTASTDPGSLRPPGNDSEIQAQQENTQAIKEPSDHAQGTPAAPPDRAQLAPGSSADLALTCRLIQGSSPLPDTEVEIWKGQYRGDRELERTARSDAHGRLAVYDLAAGRYFLRVVDARCPKSWFFRLPIYENGRTVQCGDVRVPRLAAIEGRVVDDRGKPVAGILVFHSCEWLFALGSKFRHDLIDLNDPAIDLHVRSGSDGSFRIDGVPSGVQYLRTESSEWSPAVRELRVQDGVDYQVGEIALAPGRVLRGHLTGRERQAIAGATITPTGIDNVKYPRRSVRSGADGSFELRGLGPNDRGVLIRMPGFESRSEKVDELLECESIRLTLHPTLLVRGRVLGTEEKPTTIRILPARRTPPLPAHVVALMWKRLPVRKDGSFDIEGLDRGQYLLVAHTEGVGQSARQAFRVHDEMVEFVVPILRFARLELHVVDDRGVAIEGAEIYRYPELQRLTRKIQAANPDLPRAILESWRVRDRTPLETDASGRATLEYPRQEALAFAVRERGYLPAAHASEVGRGPKALQIVLPRAARVRGKVEGKYKQHCAISIRATPVGGSPVEFRYGKNRVDGSGHFDIFLRPGRYDLKLTYANARADRDGIANPTPLLEGGDDPTSTVHVSLATGETREITFEEGKLASITGTVRDASGPLANAIVTAERPNEKDPRSLDDLAWQLSGPHVKTQANGRYEFVVNGVGVWDLHVRHEKSPLTMPPVQVKITQRGQIVERDLTVGGARVRARVELAGITDRERHAMDAYLFRRRDAHHDPHAPQESAPPTIKRMLKQKIGPDGRLEFAYLPAGDWVLRIYHGSVVHQQAVRTTPNQIADLGPIHFGLRVECKLSLDLRGIPKSRDADLFKGHSACVRQTIANSDTGMFVDAKRIKAGAATFTLAPGRYRAEIYHTYPDNGSGDANGQPTGRFCAFTVREDGSTEPATLKF